MVIKKKREFVKEFLSACQHRNIVTQSTQNLLLFAALRMSGTLIISLLLLQSTFSFLASHNHHLKLQRRASPLDDLSDPSLPNSKADLEKLISSTIDSAADSFTLNVEKDKLENTLSRESIDRASAERAASSIDSLGGKIDDIISSSELFSAENVKKRDELKRLTQLDSSAVGKGIKIGNWGPGVGGTKPNKYNNVLLKRFKVTSSDSPTVVASFLTLWSREVIGGKDPKKQYKGLTTPVMISGGVGAQNGGGNVKIVFRPREVMTGFKEEKRKEKEKEQGNTGAPAAPMKLEGGIEFIVEAGESEFAKMKPLYGEGTSGGGNNLFNLFSPKKQSPNTSTTTITVSAVRCDCDPDGRTVPKEMSEREICR